MPQPTFLTHMHLDTEISSTLATVPNITLIQLQWDSEDSQLLKAGPILVTTIKLLFTKLN